MLTFNYGSPYFWDKVVLTKFISGCRMVWDLICGTSWSYKSRTEKVTAGPQKVCHSAQLIIIIFHSQDLLSRDVLLMFPSLRRYHHNLRLHHGCPLGRPVGDFLLTDGLPIFCLDRDRLPSWHYQPHNENPVDLVLNPISSYGAH